MSLRDLFRRRPTSRYQILNHLIRTRGYREYLEIGVSTGRCIRRVRCESRTGVDPSPRVEPRGFALHEQTSDAFFASTDGDFDLIFIDGLHHAEQVLRDLLNALAVLRPGGMVLLHDCHPIAEEEQWREPLVPGGPWKGDTWKAIAYTRRFLSDLLPCRVIDLDQGMGVVVPRVHGKVPERTPQLEAHAQRYFDGLDYADLERDRQEVLGLLPDVRALETWLREQGTGLG